MDKLEPILRHKFWIIFGLTLPVALFAYFSASGEMAQATTAQEDKLKSTLSGIPSGDNDPNQTYADGAKLINQDLQTRFDEQVQKLWEMQTERMTWPKIVVPFVPDKYRGEIPSKARYTYMRVYPGVIERLWERVEPFVGDTKNNRALAEFKAEWPQKVIIDGHKIPHASFDMSAPADNKEIWDAQEDIWLLEMIFDAVARTNADAQFVSDAPVRQIDKIELVGGSGESSVTATASATGDGGMPGGAEMEMAMSGMDPGMMGPLGGAPGAMGAPVKVAFNVAEEFGTPVPEESEVDASASGSDAMGGMYPGGDGFAGMYGGAANVKVQRYIGPSGFDPFEGAYRERGFYMSVIIMQERIPGFLAELSSCPWPIRIGRFQIGENPYAQKQGPASGGFGMGGYGMADYGMADYGMEDYAMEGMGAMGGFGGMGRMQAALKLPDYMKMPTSIPAELRSHPDLVQMDLCGIITMYNPVISDEVEVTDDGSTEEEFQDELEQSAETPEEAQEMAAEAAAAQAQAAASGAAAGETPPANAATENGASPQPAASDPTTPPPAGEPVAPGTDPSAPQPAGDAPAGDAPAGDAPAGDAPAGDTPTGDTPAEDAAAETPQ